MLKKLLSQLKKLSWLPLSLLLVSPVWAGVDFAGDTDKIATSDIPVEATPITLAAWINLETLSGDESGIINKWDADTAFFWRVENDGAIRFQTSDGSSRASETAATIISAGTWYHVALTFDGEAGTGGGHATHYVDGVLKTEDTTDNTYVIQDTADVIQFGLRAASSDEFNGKMSEVAVWVGVELSQAEINLLALSKVKGMPLQIQPASLKIYLPLDDYPEGTGTISGLTFIDRSGNGNDGTGTDADNDSDTIAEEVLSYQ